MVVAAFIALAVTALTEPIVIAVMRRLAVIDHPGERSSHTVPTVRGGGVAVVVGAAAGLAYLADWSAVLAPLVAVLLFAGIGLAEDVRGVSPVRRFGLQVGAAVAVVVAVPRAGAPGPGGSGVFALAVATALGVLAVLWIVAFVNAFNFMDGVNGISAAQTVLAGGYFGWLGAHHGAHALALGGVVAAAVAVGFLPWNFPRAKVFLGDVGSYALGGLLATLAVTAVFASIRPDAAVAPLALYVADTGGTLIRRVRAGEAWYLPHRSHAYQRLAGVGWNHTAVTGTAAAVVLCSAGCGLVAASAGPVPRVCADLAVLGLTLAFLLLPGFLGRRAQPAGTPRTNSAFAAE